VQLERGAELRLTREDAPAIAAEFDRYGETAVIDLDAAMGKGSNRNMILPLLKIAECRVGGGIRSPEDAASLVEAGAAKVIIGSKAFRLPDGSFGVNTEALSAFAEAVGRARVVVAVDALSCNDGSGAYEVAVDGWKTRTGLDLVEAARAAESFAGELLFTCVDSEGTMRGLPLEPVRRLRDAVKCRLTAAGGVSSLEEVETLAALGCDAQLGMSLYTGKIALADAFVCALNWKKAEFSGGLLPLIAQSTTGQVLMTGFTDREAILETFRTGCLCFHSRTRGELWLKGRKNGRRLELRRLRADCDRDALLAIVHPLGYVCHTGDWSCFGSPRLD